MIDEGIVGSGRVIAEIFEGLGDARLDFIIVGDVGKIGLELLRDTELESSIQVINEL